MKSFRKSASSTSKRAAHALLTNVLLSLRSELGENDTLLRGLDPDEALELATNCKGDKLRLKRWIKRSLSGELLPYIIGHFAFRGHTFEIDKRAYITDPEAAHLVSAVIARATALTAARRRAPLLADIGVGCGSLALSILRELPAGRIVGLDLDPDALAVAARNAAVHRLPLRLLESDLFDSWPDSLRAPDLIYGDPPWGDASTLYESAARPASHYQAMPPASAFPLGGRTGVHRQILQAVARLEWSSEIWLNGGVLPPAELVALAKSVGAPDFEVLQPSPSVSLLRCRMTTV
jgi:methylase of polypeptide subunit release factors